MPGILPMGLCYCVDTEGGGVFLLGRHATEGMDEMGFERTLTSFIEAATAAPPQTSGRAASAGGEAREHHIHPYASSIHGFGGRIRRRLGPHGHKPLPAGLTGREPKA